MMATFISQRIMDAADVSLENGQAKYRAYFIDTAIYLRYKSDVDTILNTDGYGDCIVTE
jgi:hypothetical protein